MSDKQKKAVKKKAVEGREAETKAAGKEPAKRKPVKKKKGKKSGKGFVVLFIVIVVLLIGAGSAFVLLNQNKEIPILDTVETMVQPSAAPAPEATKLGDGVLASLVQGGMSVEEAYRKRPEEKVLTDGNKSDFANIVSCRIDTETGKIKVVAESNGIPESDDKYYYLFAMNTYDNGLAEGAEYLDRIYKNDTVELTTSLNYNTAASKLYKKFIVAVKKDDEYVTLNTPQYITNPEAIAKYTGVYQTPASKKGLLVDPNKLRGNELDDLGVKQAAYNIPVARILGPSTNSAYPTIHYNYNGKTYTFNGQVIAEYDLVFSTLTFKGICTTAIILNNYSSAYSQLIHPKARGGGSAPYYMFNGAEEGGVEYMAAIGSFLAERYSGSKHGRISNWVIANEINARKEWNYMEYTDVATYVEEYAKAFRVFYNAIKSVSSSARVYMPIDQQWDRNIKNNTNYDGRDILDEFNKNITAGGNLDWGLAQHPYNVPLTETCPWKSSKYIEHNAGTSMMSMGNIEVLVNYMNQDTFLNPDGEVRSILLSEQGYTSQGGEANQAAAFAYAYYKVEAYGDIDGFLLNRQTDAPEEVAQGLAFGLNHVGGGTKKQIYNVFKYIDTPEHAAYTDFAKSIIGISSWSEIIR